MYMYMYCTWLDHTLEDVQCTCTCTLVFIVYMIRLLEDVQCTCTHVYTCTL